MECELWRLIELSQAGDSECTLQLVSQFSPLLKKYARRLRVEDSYEILQSCLLELIARMDIKRLSCCTNGVIIKYIEKTLLHQYIALSRDARKITTVLTEDLSEHDFLNTICALVTRTNIFPCYFVTCNPYLAQQSTAFCFHCLLNNTVSLKLHCS